MAGNDFRLQSGSLAIDSGNPSSTLDDDGTRADMGAFAFSGSAEHQPCDYVGGGDGCDAADIAALYAGTDGAPASLTDALIGQWLSDASDAANPLKSTPSDVYVYGDVNLDGQVESTDLGLLLNNFNDASGLNWNGGNLNTDALVNSTDLGLLLNNFNFTSFSVAAGSATIRAPDSVLFSFSATVDDESDADGPSIELIDQVFARNAT